MQLIYRSFLAIFVLLACTLASCGEDDPVAPSESPGVQIENYLSENGLSGEITTSTGLVYIIDEPGQSEKPTISDDITINYKGYLTNGNVFDETNGSPRTFALRQLIAAWQEGIPFIGKGGKIKLIAPPSIAYGNRPPAGSGISTNSVLVFDIELLDF